MTNEEAIARIKEHMIIHKMEEPRAIHISEALNMAIKALEKQSTLDPNILEFASRFADQHNAVISFTVCALTGCDVYMGKDGNLEFIMLPRKELEIMDQHAMGSVLNDLLRRLEDKEEVCDAEHKSN